MTTNHHHSEGNPLTSVAWDFAHLVGRRFTYTDVGQFTQDLEVLDVFADRFGSWALIEWAPSVVCPGGPRQETMKAHALAAVLRDGQRGGFRVAR